MFRTITTPKTRNTVSFLKEASKVISRRALEEKPDLKDEEICSAEKTKPLSQSSNRSQTAKSYLSQLQLALEFYSVFLSFFFNVFFRSHKNERNNEAFFCRAKENEEKSSNRVKVEETDDDHKKDKSTTTTYVLLMNQK